VDAQDRIRHADPTLPARHDWTVTTMPWLIPLILGAVIGAGVWLVLRELLHTEPALGSALDRLSGADQPSRTTMELHDGSLSDRLGVALSRRTSLPRIKGITPSPADLELLGKAPHALLGEKALVALIGLIAIPALSVMFSLLGLNLPIVIPLLGTVLFAAGCWFLPDIDATSKAATARTEFTRAVGAYLELLAIERMSGAGAIQATEGAATVAKSWPFERISQTLHRARWAGVTPWAALNELGDELEVPALHDVADIMRLAGAEGAAVVEQLRGRTRSLRGAQISLDRATANDDSTRMTIPATLTVGVFLLAMVIPVGMTVFSRGAA
jgi:hypothetical protein